MQSCGNWVRAQQFWFGFHILVEIHPPLLWGTVDHHVKSKIEECINQVPSRSFARALKYIVDTDQDPFFFTTF